MIKLRPYQVRAIEDCRKAYSAKARGVVLVLPTGAGKTCVAAEVAKRHPGTTVVVCHRRELIEQTADKLSLVGLKAGLLTASESFSGDVLVCSLQTMLARKQMPPASLLVCDEVQHLGSEVWGQLPKSYEKAHRLGLTATPQRADGKPLQGFDALVVGVTTKELTDMGHLVPCDVYAPAKRLRGQVVDPVKAYEEYGRGKPTILFARSVEQAKELAKSLGGECVDGNMPEDERAAALERFKNGKTNLITNCFVLTEGFDATRAQVCIVARGCSAAGTWLQMIGRVLRPHPGKDRATVVDLTGACHEHGLPTDERKWSLDGKAHELLVDKKKDKIKQCPKCTAVTRDPVCPSCGFVFPKPRPPRVVRERLHNITYVDPDDADMLKRRRSYDFFMYQARTKGYKAGWAAYRYKSKYGDWPPREWKQAFDRGEYDEADYGEEAP